MEFFLAWAAIILFAASWLAAIVVLATYFINRSKGFQHGHPQASDVTTAEIARERKELEALRKEIEHLEKEIERKK